MNYSLDTNAVIAALRQPAGGLVRKLRAHPAESVTVCSIVRAELFYGAMKSQHPSRSLGIQQEFLAAFPSLVFDDVAALVFGELRSDLERHGQPVGPYDLQIAAIAIANNLTLVTHNAREFSRIRGLKTVDWQ